MEKTKRKKEKEKEKAKTNSVAAAGAAWTCIIASGDAPSGATRVTADRPRGKGDVPGSNHGGNGLEWFVHRGYGFSHGSGDDGIMGETDPWIIFFS